MNTPNIPDCAEYRDARGRTPVDPAIFKQPHSAVIGFAGQSMLGNFGSWLTPYNPCTGGVYELDTITGNIYEVTDGSFPTMGMNGWFAGEVPGPIRRSVLPYWADMLVKSGKAARVLIAAHNIGGTHAARWCPIGDLYQRSAGTIQWLKSLGIPPNYWIEMLGQADANANTAPVTYNGNVLSVCGSAQNFADLMQWKFVGLRGEGLDCTIVVGKGAHWTGVSDVQPARYAMVKQGQLLCASGQYGAGVSLGPDDDEWPDTERVDGVHPADAMRFNQWTRWDPVFPSF